MTAETWGDAGDYIHYVYDAWLRDRTGRFMVAVDEPAGAIVAIDKLSFFSPGEAWFEGLRVSPAYRGRGIAAHFQRRMLDEAERLGAKSVRFLTLARNLAVHKMAFRDGFRELFQTRWWRAEVAQHIPLAPPDATRLRPASVAEADALYALWACSASAFATAGLLHGRWTFTQTGPAEWQELASRRMVLVAEQFSADSAAVLPPMTIVRPETDQDGTARWSVSIAHAEPGAAGPLAAGLLDAARERGIMEVSALLPDTHGTFVGFSSAGFKPDPDDDVLVVFEKRF
jgi:GNAT superfamily N-acetyltransferase